MRHVQCTPAVCLDGATVLFVCGAARFFFRFTLLFSQAGCFCLLCL
ncbi:TPA: hypothetical protein N5O25_001344 [Enterobacter hormaechei subsp. xiangfangensis]|nr:hypothetical protein [Enterobacter hormaechei subsp. xiangfangensis]